MPVAVLGFFGTLLALRRIPVVARALAAPGTMNRLELPQAFRVIEGTAFLAFMALGHLPALFALPAGLGDITAGIIAPLAAHRLAQGGGRREHRGRPPSRSLPPRDRVPTPGVTVSWRPRARLAGGTCPA
jgi:hypothetical protein